ncbi:hypothetical protein BKA70DRAFT_1223996 [Coprinopsis sp. MPI-PUGE-AT-0042]|nr:hypothetical protein BKA70DRAFT_1223996 [Coprinopsis sp. MPI-PUGE-AT-0042]
MKGTISQPRTKDSTFKAKSVGSSIELFGTVQQVAGNITVSYNIDVIFFETIVTSHNFQDVNRTNWSLNRRLFGQPNLSWAGGDNAEYVLDATVTNISGDQMLSLDYLTFTGTRWTNVTSPGSALVTPFPESGESGSRGSSKRRLAIGLGVSLPLVLITGAGLLFLAKFNKRKNPPK